jgi:gas vesicle protein
MTTNNDPDQIRSDIELTRSQLSGNVDALVDTADPRNVAHRQMERVKGAVSGARDTIMGAPDDPRDSGRVGDLKDNVAETFSDVGDTVSHAPSAVKQKARGNPLAAGLVAFGAGLLVSSLVPASQKEQRAVSELQQKAEPLKEKAVEAVKDAADQLKAPALGAVDSVKTTASDAANRVKDEGQAAKQQVQGQAQESASTVREVQGN